MSLHPTFTMYLVWRVVYDFGGIAPGRLVIPVYATRSYWFMSLFDSGNCFSHSRNKLLPTTKAGILWMDRTSGINFVEFESKPWWRHEKATLSVLMALCNGNPPVHRTPMKRASYLELLVMFSLMLTKPKCWTNKQFLRDLRLNCNNITFATWIKKSPTACLLIFINGQWLVTCSARVNADLWSFGSLGHRVMKFKWSCTHVYNDH